MNMFPIVNVLVRLLLRSPFHRLMSGNTLFINFTGVRSGKRYAIPTSYIQDGDVVRCFTSARWARNLRGGVPVRLRLRGRWVSGTAELVVDDKDAVASGMTELLRRVRRDAGFHNVRLDPNGEPDPADLERAANRNAMIRITLRGVQ